MDYKNHIVISLGGSVIVPDQLDIDILREFTEVITEYTKKGFRFVIITGGGKTCRNYDNSLKQIVNPKSEDLDILGIATTRLNAEFVRICFGDIAHDKIILDPNFIPETNKPIIVGGGWHPGNSSDLVAVYIAKNIGANKIINLSNIDYVYSKDPKKYQDATPISKSSWEDFRKILPKEWDPGLNIPFDPIAAKEAEGLSLEVIIMNGKNLNNLKNYLDDKEFVGTIIK